jgi:hypothetical protein
MAYELALLQFVPDPSSEECANVGVVAFSPSTGGMVFRFNDRYGRVRTLYPEVIGSRFRSLIQSLSRRAREIQREAGIERPGGQQLALDRLERIEELLHRIVPPGNANFRWSSVRFGVCASLADALTRTFDEYITRREPKPTRKRREDADVWRHVTSNTAFRRVESALQPEFELSTPDYRYVFKAAWNNGGLHVVEPISLDYLDPRDMVEEAARWRGRLDELSLGNDFAMTVILSDPPQNGALRQYDQAQHILERDERIRRVIKESRADDFVDLVESDLQSQHSQVEPVGGA